MADAKVDRFIDDGLVVITDQAAERRRQKEIDAALEDAASRAVTAAAGWRDRQAFHLPGRHNQKSHGDGNTGIGVRKGGKLVEGESASDRKKKGGASGSAMAEWEASRKAQDGLIVNPKGPNGSPRSAEDSLGWYMGSMAGAGHVHVNGILRGTGKDDFWAPVVAREVKDLDAVLEMGHRTESDVTVYRNIKSGYGKWKAGDTVWDSGFTSTSADRDVAMKWDGGFGTGKVTGAIMEIRVPKGTPVASMDKGAPPLKRWDESGRLVPVEGPRGQGGEGNEFELLLDRSSSFEVLEVSQTDDGRKKFVVQMNPASASRELGVVKVPAEEIVFGHEAFGAGVIR